MRFHPALALACLIAAPAFAQSYDEAVAQLKARVVKEGGSGLVFMVERTDVFGVQFKMQAVGADFSYVSLRPWGENRAPIFSYSGKTTTAVDGSGRLNEEPNVLFVEVSGDAFHPKVTLKLPRRGEKPEVQTVYFAKGEDAAK